MELRPPMHIKTVSQQCNDQFSALKCAARLVAPPEIHFQYQQYAASFAHLPGHWLVFVLDLDHLTPNFYRETAQVNEHENSAHGIAYIGNLLVSM
jgi:hypothetical protein